MEQLGLAKNLTLTHFWGEESIPGVLSPLLEWGNGLVFLANTIKLIQENKQSISPACLWNGSAGKCMSLGLTWSLSKIHSSTQQKSRHILGIGDTVVNKRNKPDEVPARMEPMCLSPIMRVVTNPSQVYSFSACLVGFFFLSPTLCYLARWNFYFFGGLRSCQ